MLFLNRFLVTAVGHLLINCRCISCGNEEIFMYRTYSEINEYLESLQTKHKEKVTSFTIGYSVEGRQINGIKIHEMENNSTPRAILIESGMHAREWIAPAVLLYTIDQLLENEIYSNMTDQLDWYLLPMLNPDGYVYSMDPNGDRLWRKNRTPTSLPYCQGVDLNRNFGYYWGGLGSSDDPCSLSYRGPHPFSEPESQAFAQFVLSVKEHIKLYLSLHSAAQAILYPWGYTNLMPPDWMDLQNLAMKGAEAIEKLNGTQYSIGPTTLLVGAGAGGSDDWAKGSADIKYVYTIELPGPKYQKNGFHVPPEEVPKILEESFQGIKALAEGILL